MRSSDRLRGHGTCDRPPPPFHPPAGAAPAPPVAELGSLAVMERAAHIQLKSGASEMRFDWLGFDGDDCFDDFHITVADDGQPRRFDFGPCVVRGLRKFVRFFGDTSQPTIGGGFRHLDIRYYDLHRSGEDYRLVIRFEGSGLHEEFHIHQPAVHIADQFLKDYDG